MNNLTSLSLFVLLCVVLQACTPVPSPETPLADESQQNTVRLIHMNDLHAHLTAHLDFELNDGMPIIVEKGGLPRIATTIKQMREQQTNNILLNIGDTYHGGVEAVYTNGNAIVDPVDALNIDLGVPGNWDYAYGPSVTRLRYTGQGRNPTGQEVKQVNYPNLAANVTSTSRLPFLPATHIIEKQGIHIGFIGLTSDIVPRMSPGLAVGFDFLQGKENYITLVNNHAAKLREQGANAIVVLSELGIHKDITLANHININSVDVFLSAHTHELTREPIESNSGAIIVEAGNDGYLGQMDLLFDAQKQLSDRQWQVISIDAKISDDVDMTALVNSARQEFLSDDVNISMPSPIVDQTLSSPIDTVIGQTSTTLDRRQALENNFNRAFPQMLKQLAGTDLAITPGFRYDSVLPGLGYVFEDAVIANGDITIEDAYRLFPVGFYLASGTTSGENLKRIIEANLSSVFSTDTFKHSGGWTDGFSGVDLQVNLANADGQRISAINLQDSLQTIENSDQLSVAGCVRPVEVDSGNTLCSYDGFENVTTLINPHTGTAWTAVDFLISQISKNLLPTEQRSHIHDENNTPMWPDAEYVQPLYGVQ